MEENKNRQDKSIDDFLFEESAQAKLEQDESLNELAQNNFESEPQTKSEEAPLAQPENTPQTQPEKTQASLGQDEFEVEPQTKSEELPQTKSDFIKSETIKPEDKITVRPVKFQEFSDNPPNRTIKKNLDILQDINLHISVELGRAKSSIKEVMAFEKGSIIELNKVAGEQVEIYVNDKLIAKGEVIVIEDKFGVRVTNTNLGNGVL